MTRLIPLVHAAALEALAGRHFACCATSKATDVVALENGDRMWLWLNAQRNELFDKMHEIPQDSAWFQLKELNKNKECLLNRTVFDPMLVISLVTKS